MTSKKKMRGTPIARIEVINARGIEIGKAQLNALLRSIRATFAAAGKTPATAKAARLDEGPQVECWIESVTFEYIDDVLYRVEHWKCDDGSSFDKYIPIG
jgi:hypothetical protein